MKPISLYIHWPFCLSLCPYCDFNSHLSSSIDHTHWLNAYKKEIDHFADKLSKREIKSIFFGGGTPSLMHPRTVAGVIDHLSNISTISNNIEITLEANPTSYEANKFREFKSAGINRISIGIQSLKTESLELLGRKHSVDEAVLALKSGSKIFNRYSFDLIYALPNQQLHDWQQELSKAIELANGHISLYQLTIEKGTPFYKTFNSGQMQLPENDIAADMYEWTNNYLQEHNYNHYEISNYSSPDNECIHNLSYWNYAEYLGIGPGAHSRLHDKNNIRAVMMVHNPKKWLTNIEDFGHGILTNNILSKKNLIEEIIMMGTRLKQGMSIKHFQQIANLDFNSIMNQTNLSYFQQKRLVFKNEFYFGLTKKGMLLHNYLIPRLIN